MMAYAGGGMQAAEAWSVRFVLSGETWQYGMESWSGVLSYLERHGNTGSSLGVAFCPIRRDMATGGLASACSVVRRSSEGGLHLKETTPTTLSCLRTGTGSTVQIIITGQVQAVQYR